MAADREQGKIAPVNPRALTWYGEANVIIDEWADQFVQTANRRPGEGLARAHSIVWETVQDTRQESHQKPYSVP
jgi:hypothetical protein